MTATLRLTLAGICLTALFTSVHAAEKVTVKLPNGVATACDVVKVSPTGAVLKAAGKEMTLPLEKMSPEEVVACHKAVADAAPAQSRFEMGNYFMKKQQWEQAEEDLNAAVKLDAALKEKADPLLKAITVVKEINGGKGGNGAGVVVVGPDGKTPAMKKPEGSSEEGEEEDFAKRFMKRDVPARSPAEMKQFLDERLAELKKVIAGGEWRMIETQHFYCFYNGTPEKHKQISGWNEFLYGRLCEVLKHKEGDKNTCVNAPAALGCFRLARWKKEPEAAKWNAEGEKIVVWTVKTLQGENSLFWDNIDVASGQINKGQLTYNSGLMLRNFISLHTRTGKQFYLDEALRMGKAADGLLDQGKKMYRDPLKWSHLMIEADLELYRKTGQDQYLKRAIADAEGHYAKWKEKPADDLITEASLARELWLLVDHSTPAGKEFWKASDKPRAK